MHFVDIMLRDFGAEVFRDARMDGLENGLTVIGGPQRAGKTTFLEAIRRLGYGIESGADLPPPADTYNIRATVHHDGYEYILKLEGHSDPTVVSVAGGPDQSVADLYGSVSKTQYQQLFTITLDELQRIPETVDDAEDLSEVLLGAAYGDVSVIPDMQSDFSSRAYDIGRKHGRPTKNSELRGPMDTIEEGIERRDEANKQVDEWGAARAELQEITQEIEDLESEIDQLKHRKERLSVLEDELESLRTYQTLREEIDSADVATAESMPDDAVDRTEELEKAYRQAVERRDKKQRELATNAPTDDVGAYKEDLIAHQSELRTYDRQVEKWKQQSEKIDQQADKLRTKRSELQQAVQTIHADWDGDFEEVLAVETGALTADEVDAAVAEYEDASADVNEAEKKQRELEDQRHALERQLSEARNNQDDTTDTRTVLGQAGAVSVVSLFVAVGGAIAGVPLLGGGAAVIVLLIGLYAVLSRSDSNVTEAEPIRELKADKRSVERELSTVENSLEAARERQEAAEQQLEEVREWIGLPASVSPAGVQTFYEEVEDCKAEIQDLKGQESRLQTDREKLLNELSNAAETMETIRLTQWDDDELLDDIDGLVTAIETARNDLEVARDLDDAEQSVEDVERDIETLLGEWDAVGDLDTGTATPDAIQTALQTFHDQATEAESVQDQVERRDELEDDFESKLQTGSTETAFEAVKSPDESYLEAFERIAAEYGGSEAVSEELDDVRTTLEEKSSTHTDKTERRIELRNKLEDLKSDEDIGAAREQITEGRQELRKLGEEYAVNRIAEYLTERLHERFIEEVAGPLIDEASEIFQRITKEYDGISHNDQFDDLDFEALQEGKPPHGSNELSRATAEQLFLAVRLARIRQLDVSLPVVMDDAMTNFDPAHGARTLQIVAELAKTHQVFFLTCHPEHVMLAEAYGDAAQFWCLNDGHFTGPHDDSDHLYELLHTEAGSSIEAD